MSPMQTVNYNVLKSLDLLDIDDRVRQLRLKHVLTYIMEKHHLIFLPILL